MRPRRQSGDWLFAEDAIVQDVIDTQRRALDKALAELSASELRVRSLDELTADLVERFRLDAPALDRSRIVQLPVEEVDLDVSRDPLRMIVDRSRPFYIKGTQLAIAVPFTGEATLFRYRTSQFNSPHPGEVVDDMLVLKYQGEHPDASTARRDFERRLGAIESTLYMVRGHCDAWNEELARTVPQRLGERLAKAKRDEGLSLGFPAAQAKPARQPTVKSGSPAGTRQYELFLSHASEDKAAVARPLYEALTRAGVQVWFDEAVLRLGDSLRRKIDDGLARCRFGIVILSPSFFAKEWPQRELDGLVARETSSGEKAILPIWHDLDDAAVLRYSPPLADRLAGRSSDGVDALVAKILEAIGRS